MERNEGTTDRLIRIVLGLVFLPLALVSSMTWIGWLAILPIATGVAGYCPLYQVLHIRTCPRQRVI